MQTYNVGGLTLSSPTPLAELRQVDDRQWDRSDIAFSIEHRPCPEPDRVLFKWPGRYGLTLGVSGVDWVMTWARGAGFLISDDGRKIRARCEPDGLDTESVHVLVRRILPRICLMFGAVALHAAALGKQRGAILVLGASGAGKSTLSAALGYHHGWDLLSDDISIMRKDNRTTLSPAATGVCLWPDSREGLGLPIQRCHALRAYRTKIWFDLEQNTPRPKQQLRALVTLSRSEANLHPALQPIDPGAALVLAALQLIQFNPAESWNGEYVALVARLRAAIEGVPAFTLSYPADYDALPRVSALLDDLVL